MTFKEVVRMDIAETFLNMEEFAEKHLIDGRELTVIVDNNEQLEREKRYRMLDDGLYRKQILFYVSAEEFGRLPKIGRLMEFDSMSYQVTDAIREGGMYSISLEANK